MNDIENEIYTYLAENLRSQFEGINVSGDYQPLPPAFPHVSIIMTDNSVIRQTTTDAVEHTNVAFDINIYSNRQQGKKSEAKSIARAVDDLLRPKNFMRISSGPIPNADDSSIYRICSRYTVETDGRFLYKR